MCGYANLIEVPVVTFYLYNAARTNDWCCKVLRHIRWKLRNEIYLLVTQLKVESVLNYANFLSKKPSVLMYWFISVDFGIYLAVQQFGFFSETVIVFWNS